MLRTPFPHLVKVADWSLDCDPYIGSHGYPISIGAMLVLLQQILRVHSVICIRHVYPIKGKHGLRRKDNFDTESTSKNPKPGC